MRLLCALLLLASIPAQLSGEEGAPKALTWHHEGFVAISKAANEAKFTGKRLLLGLSGVPT